MVIYLNKLKALDDLPLNVWPSQSEAPRQAWEGSHLAYTPATFSRPLRGHPLVDAQKFLSMAADHVQVQFLVGDCYALGDMVHQRRQHLVAFFGFDQGFFTSSWLLAMPAKEIRDGGIDDDERDDQPEGQGNRLFPGGFDTSPTYIYQLIGIIRDELRFHPKLGDQDVIALRIHRPGCL